MEWIIPIFGKILLQSIGSIQKYVSRWCLWFNCSDYIVVTPNVGLMCGARSPTHCMRQSPSTTPHPFRRNGAWLEEGFKGNLGSLYEVPFLHNYMF